jgi:hypothetical protein
MPLSQSAPDARTRELSGKTFAIVALALLLAASLCPVLLVRIPAMADYPDHLARMYILNAAGTADQNPFYQIVWALYPNLAMDVLVPPLARFVGAELATRLFLLLSEILLVAGALAIERVVKGRMQLAGFAAVMFLYSLPFSFGFLNFEFGLAMALFGIAAMLAVQDRSWAVRLLVNTAFVVIVFVAHFFALGVYGATLGLYELWRASDKKSALGEIARRLSVLALPAVVLLAAVALTGSSIGGAGSSWLFVYKPLWLLHIFNGYSLPVSEASLVVLAGLLYAAARGGVLKVSAAGLWIAIGFAVLYVAIPSRLLGTSYADCRIVAAAAFILPAFCTLSLPGRRWLAAAVTCFAAITLANLAAVSFVWLSFRADYAELIESFGKIEKNALVLVSHNAEGGDSLLDYLFDYPIYNAPTLLYHAPTLAVHYANAFVPTFFAVPGKQPVVARPAYQHLTEHDLKAIVPVFLLAAIAQGKTAEAPRFIRNWPQDFNYLYVLGPRVGNPLPGTLTELYTAPRFVLYAVRK